jgi:hypothetical protein
MFLIPIDSTDSQARVPYVFAGQRRQIRIYDVGVSVYAREKRRTVFFAQPITPLSHGSIMNGPVYIHALNILAFLAIWTLIIAGLIAILTDIIMLQDNRFNIKFI